MNPLQAWLLGSGDPPGRQFSLHEMISLLETELAKGEADYTPAQLAVLTRKLSDYRNLLRVLTHGG